MWPNRVGGISAACAEAFRPYNPVLSALTGTCYWWALDSDCGLTALLSAWGVLPRTAQFFGLAGPQSVLKSGAAQETGEAR